MLSAELMSLLLLQLNTVAAAVRHVGIWVCERCKAGVRAIVVVELLAVTASGIDIGGVNAR